MKLVLAALVLASAASCGIAFAAESYSGECLPTGAALAADATLGAAAGAYRLTMVGGRPGEAEVYEEIQEITVLSPGAARTSPAGSTPWC